MNKSDEHDLRADIAVLTSLVEVLYEIACRKHPDSIARLDGFARHFSEEIAMLSWPGADQETSNYVADKLASSTDRILGGVRKRLANTMRSPDLS